MKKILVTGCGSLLGQGIIKTILSIKKYKIFGTDYIKDSIGHYWVKKVYILPDILKKNTSINKWYIKILNIIKRHKINYLIPGLDFELQILNKIKSKIEKNTKCRLIISDKRVIDICRDKWKTNMFLKKNNSINIDKLYFSRGDGTITCMKFDDWYNHGNLHVSKGWKYLCKKNK